MATIVRIYEQEGGYTLNIIPFLPHFVHFLLWEQRNLPVCVSCNYLLLNAIIWQINFSSYTTNWWVVSCWLSNMVTITALTVQGLCKSSLSGSRFCVCCIPFQSMEDRTKNEWVYLSHCWKTLTGTFTMCYFHIFLSSFFLLPQEGTCSLLKQTQSYVPVRERQNSSINSS